MEVDHELEGDHSPGIKNKASLVSQMAISVIAHRFKKKETLAESLGINFKMPTMLSVEEEEVKQDEGRKESDNNDSS